MKGKITTFVLFQIFFFLGGGVFLLVFFLTSHSSIISVYIKSQTKYTNGSLFSILLHIIRVCYMFRPYVGHYH